MTAAATVCAPEIAVITDVPAATEVTNPASEIVATAVSDDDHVTLASPIAAPPASLTVAVS